MEKAEQALIPLNRAVRYLCEKASCVAPRNWKDFEIFPKSGPRRSLIIACVVQRIECARWWRFTLNRAASPALIGALVTQGRSRSFGFVGPSLTTG